MQGTIGEIRAFGGNFAPRTWSFCQGQLVSIAQNTALFSILGTTYGGDGRTTFALPDLRGRIPLGQGRGPGLSSRPLGQRSGQEDVLLNLLAMPSHFHFATSTPPTATVTGTVSAQLKASASSAGEESPTDNSLAAGDGSSFYSADAPMEEMHSDSVEVSTNGLAVHPSGMSASLANAGGSQDHNNIMPYNTINWIICLEGDFPSRS